MECTLTATTFERLLDRKQDGNSPPVNVTFDVEDMLKRSAAFVTQSASVPKRRRRILLTMC